MSSSPLTISTTVWSGPKIFGIVLAKILKLIFGDQKFLPTSPTSPHGQKYLSRRPKMTLKFCVNFDIKLHKKQDKFKKIHTRVSEDFLGPKVTTPKFGGQQKFLRVWVYFWKFELWVKNFSKISYLQKVP